MYTRHYHVDEVEPIPSILEVGCATFTQDEAISYYFHCTLDYERSNEEILSIIDLRGLETYYLVSDSLILCVCVINRPDHDGVHYDQAYDDDLENA